MYAERKSADAYARNLVESYAERESEQLTCVVTYTHTVTFVSLSFTHGHLQIKEKNLNSITKMSV